MAGPPKKPKKIEKPTESGDESMSEEENEIQTETEIQANFDGRFLGAEHYHGIKRLLLQLFLKADIDLGQITDLLIGQTGIGSVLQQAIESDDDDEEEDMDVVEATTVFAVTSILNLTANKETPCIKQLYSLLEELTVQHASQEAKEGITKILQQNDKIGFLIHERIVNIPAKISVPMLTALNEEIEKTKKKNTSYDFDYLIIISKTTKPKIGQNGVGETFTNEEEQFFLKKAEWTFDFNVEKDCDLVAADCLPEEEQLVPFRRISVFRASVFRNIVDTITNIIN
ncbi:unnamed protein product [Ceutorhynchus assimilis]|uniref:Protein BCCIP homolog n=1 Tax=Ceutorhynchus assimilis TaxID=467358 RepID=A0A9N9MY04_9CUCU|nr:unnamed protein product [Ceutorhynchus assimilis]